MPLSNLTWTRAPDPCAEARAESISRKPWRQTASSELAARTMSTSSWVSAPRVNSGTCR